MVARILEGEYYTIKEVSDMFNTTRQTIGHYVKTGRLKAVFFMHRYYIKKDDIEKFVTESEIDTNNLPMKHCKQKKREE